MAEETKTGANEESGNLGQEPAGDPSAKESSQTFTQADMDAVVNTALKNAKAQWQKEHEKGIQEAVQETERLAKLSAAEKEAEIKRKEEEKYAAERKQFEWDKSVFATTRKLAAEKLPIEFAEMLADTDGEATAQNIEVFKAQWNAAVELAVKEKLKGKTPTVAPGGAPQKSKKEMSYEEFCAYVENNPGSKF